MSRAFTRRSAVIHKAFSQHDGVSLRKTPGVMCPYHDCRSASLHLPAVLHAQQLDLISSKATILTQDRNCSTRLATNGCQRASAMRNILGHAIAY